MLTLNTIKGLRRWARDGGYSTVDSLLEALNLAEWALKQKAKTAARLDRYRERVKANREKVIAAGKHRERTVPALPPGRTPLQTRKIDLPLDPDAARHLTPQLKPAKKHTK